MRPVKPCVSPGASDWAGGVWLVTQNCFSDDSVPDAAGVEYNFGVPGALAYGNARLGAYGYTSVNSALYGTVRNNSGTTSGMSGALLSSQPATRWFGWFSLANRVSSERRVVVQLTSFSPCDCQAFTDYDIRYVYLYVTYGALAPQ